MSCKYFENRDCEYYPCHNIQNQNCLFCFCPLYFLDCGGDFVMKKCDNDKMIKDCSGCIIPHACDGYDYIINKLKETGV